MDASSSPTASWTRAWGPIALIVVVTLAAAVLPRRQESRLRHAPADRVASRPVVRLEPSPQAAAARQTAAEIQALLAQAGCPGWDDLPEALSAGLRPSPQAVAWGPSIPGERPVFSPHVASRSLPEGSPPPDGNALLPPGEDLTREDVRDVLGGSPPPTAAPPPADAAAAGETPSTAIQPPASSEPSITPGERGDLESAPRVAPQREVAPRSPARREPTPEAAESPAASDRPEGAPPSVPVDPPPPTEQGAAARRDSPASGSPAGIDPPQPPGASTELLPLPPAPDRGAAPTPPAEPEIVTPNANGTERPMDEALPGGVADPRGQSASPASSPHAAASADAAKQPSTFADRCEFIANTQYPSALECRTCHEKIYEEWSISSHAYAYVSPMFHKFEQRLQELTQGTIGYFCQRCHTPAGTSLGIDRTTPYWELPQVAREGVTCVACHRVRENYGKSNGERRIEPGDIHAPVYGSFGGDGVARGVAEKDKYKFKTSPHDKGPGQPLHIEGAWMPQLAKSEFCASCHQVAVHPGIKLEVVWEQYRASPACRKGIRCQDCHMGRIPGVPSGFETGAAAELNKQNVHPARKHSNHVFWGPGYSIAHPGLFPFNPRANQWTPHEWLQFDWRAGWGTDDFEDAVDDGRIRAAFPEAWRESDDRYDARIVLEENLKKRRLKDFSRKHVMENGSHVDGPFFAGPPAVGADLKLHYVVVNRNDGHHLITASLGAQPQLWANVVLVGPRGQRLWESGYLDSLGDLADIHSEDVRHKRLAYDWQLFNLQTMFLITGVKGADREFPLPVNFSIDQLPFIRPGVQPIPNINHPPLIRMEMRSIAPLGSRRVPYRIPGHVFREPGDYRLTFRLRSRLEPPYFMRFCRSTPEMVQAMNEGILDFHEFSYQFVVPPGPPATTAAQPVPRNF